MGNLRAGLIGMGMMGRNHARILSSLPGVDFVSILDPLLTQDDKALPTRVAADIVEFVSLNLDYAVVAVPTSQHFKISEFLASNGINSLIEKPITHNIESAKQLVHAFNSRGLIGGVGFVERFNPAIQEARKRIEQIGELFQITSRRQGVFPQRITDVGVIQDLATHDINLTTWITSKNYNSIFSRSIVQAGRSHEDLVAIIGTLEGGIVANHLVNWLSPQKERVTTVTGSKGAFIIDTLTADLTFFANGNYLNEWDGISQFRGVSEGDMTRYSFQKQEPLRVEHEHFRNAILGKPNEIVTLEQGLQTTIVAEAIRKSSVTNELIYLDVIK